MKKTKYHMIKWTNESYMVGVDLRGAEGFSVAEVNAGDLEETKRIAKLLVKALNKKVVSK